jgi:hypothetical protein
MRGIGAHEVIVENPDHNLLIPDMPRITLGIVVDVWPTGVRDLIRDRRFKYILLFKNHLPPRALARAPAYADHRDRRSRPRRGDEARVGQGAPPAQGAVPVLRS